MAGINDGGGSGFKTRRDAYDEQQNNLQTMLFKAGSEDKENKLKQLLQSDAQKHDLTKQQGEWAHDKQTSEDSERRARGIVDEYGGKGKRVNASVGKDGSVVISENEPSLANQLAQQGMKFNKVAQDTFKPIHEQLTAARGTIDALDQKNAVSDKLALINEARLAAGSGGSRAIKSMVDTLSGGKTANSDWQGAMNWLENTPNIPTMSDAQRDAIRESVHNRIGQVQNDHQMALAKLRGLGPAIAPGADTNSIISANAGPAEDNLKYVIGKRDAYMKARQGAPNPISNPSVADPNPTNLDRLKSLFGYGPKAAAPAAAAPQGPATGAPPAGDDLVSQAAAMLKQRRSTPRSQ